MTEDTSQPRLYLYVKDWERHQPRADRPNLPWLRLHTDLLGNDAWLELSTADRCLLIGIWMVTQRYGNGRLLADERWLKSQAKAHKSSLDRLVQAGFVELSTTKAEPFGALEEKRIERKEEKKDAAGAKKAHGVLSENGIGYIHGSLLAIKDELTEEEYAELDEDTLSAMVHDLQGEFRKDEEPMTRAEIKDAIAALLPRLGAP